MLTGCRKSKILAFRWDDVDRTAGEFRLRDGKRARMVPLTTPALKVLDGIEHVEGNPWVIRSQKPGSEATRTGRVLRKNTDRSMYAPCNRKPCVDGLMALTHSRNACSLP